MSKYTILSLPLAILMFITMNLYFTNYDRESWREFQERKLDISVNYAVDAAIDEIIANTTNLGVDYADFERIKVEPGVALDQFLAVFLRNMNYADTEENRIMVKSDNLPVFIVAGYDGYYLGQPMKINESGAYDIVFSLKQPYSYTDDAGRAYALNLGLNDARRYNGTRIDKVSPVPLTKLEQKEIITTNITDAMQKTILDQREGNSLTTIYIPLEMTTISRTNPISNVSVMAYVDNVFIGPGDRIDSFAIGGAHVTHEKFVGGYIRDGVKYYAYVTNIPDSVRVLETFENAQYAAEAGYYFDPMYLQ